MTGIERLYKLIADIDVNADPELWDILRDGTEGDWDCDENDDKTLCSTLAAIADQIEREQGEHVSLMRVLKVASDMEHHILGHEGMEDSPVARWARELRSLRDWLDNAEPVYPMTVLLRRCKEFGVDTSDCEDGEDVLNNLIETLRQRLMPEGMEWLLEVWPKWSNGEYCKFGDWWTADKYGDFEPKQLRRLVFYTPEQLREWEQDEGDNFGYEWDFMRPSDTTYRPDKAEPPAPKALDADGAEIRAGDTVYHVKDGSEMTVYEIEGEWLVVSVGGRVRHDVVTHRAPVLAADGEPLEVGQTAWEVDGTGHAFEVVGIRPDTGRAMEPTVVTCDVGDGTSEHFLPSQLTHQRPDSWERIEEDAGCTATKYNERRGTIFTTKQQVARDLVRRCRALAERERGE